MATTKSAKIEAEIRLCRSIQVEGAFGLLKNDFGFRRFLTRGRKNIRTELFFLALAFNLKKLWMKRDKGRLRTHLSEISAAQPYITKSFHIWCWFPRQGQLCYSKTERFVARFPQSLGPSCSSFKN